MSDYVIYPYDCVDTMLHILDEKSVHCVVTSPPYFNLRDYKTARYVGGNSEHEHDRMPHRNGRGGSGAPGKNTANAFPATIPAPLCSCGAVRVDHQIGTEATPDEYVRRIVEVGRAIWRVLRDDGTFWLNIGDSYANDSKWGGSTGGKHVAALHGDTSIGRAKRSTGLKSKDLMMIPARVALALQADGWYLRNDIIWDKPNVMPKSARDRFTDSHEHLFFFTKRPRYFFDQEAIKEPAIYANKDSRAGKGRHTYDVKYKGAAGTGNEAFVTIHAFRNKRDVWRIPTRPFKGGHFAAFPPALIEPCILAGSPPWCCSACGAPRVPKHEKTLDTNDTFKGSTFDKGKTGARDGGERTQPGDRYVSKLVGYVDSCDCKAPDAPATVLDPFGGTGTTAIVALRFGRRAVLCELNPEYVDMAYKRIAGGK